MHSDIIDTLVELGHETPFFVYDLRELSRSLDNVRSFSDAAACKLLYSLKACSCGSVLDVISEKVYGFSCSSAFEAAWANECGNDETSIHFTSPGIKSSDLEMLEANCDYLTINSMSQWRRFSPELLNGTNLGLRLNPKLSFVEDSRYNPCRKHSKLGVPLSDLKKAFLENEGLFENLTGIGFHSNCDSDDFGQLLAIVSFLDSQLGDILHKVDWINLGGGYLFESSGSTDELVESVELLKSKYDLEVFIEPGAGIVRSCGYLVSSVIDIFVSDGKQIAVLDTTVNHLPEVFEYQYSHDIASEKQGGEYEYILAGSSCLSGDVFGEYAFENKLELGDRIIFVDAGAYSLAKAHTFNGINLPDVYTYGTNGEIKIEKKHTYDDFRNRLVGDPNDIK
jgi:carboxynorspermidine decarboxylase